MDWPSFNAALAAGTPVEFLVDLPGDEAVTLVEDSFELDTVDASPTDGHDADPPTSADAAVRLKGDPTAGVADADLCLVFRRLNGLTADQDAATSTDMNRDRAGVVSSTAAEAVATGAFWLPRPRLSLESLVRPMLVPPPTEAQTRAWCDP